MTFLDFDHLPFQQTEDEEPFRAFATNILAKVGPDKKKKLMIDADNLDHGSELSVAWTL
jgi:hypothetical protein